MMAFAHTVGGPVAADALGHTQPHEHIFIAAGYAGLSNPSQVIDDCEKSLRELGDYRAGGGRSLVDAQPIGCGRSAAVLEQLGRDSGVHIIASTGFHKRAFYPTGHWMQTETVDMLGRLFVHELTCGMYLDGDNTPPAHPGAAKAGIIKAALDVPGLSGQYRTQFEAAAAAALQTGAPLMVHVEAGSNPVALADWLIKHGLPPTRLIFCHMDRAIPDSEIHLEVAGRGVFLEYDTIGRFKYHSDEAELDIIGRMLEAGRGRQLLLSLDTTRQRLRAYGGATGLDYLLAVFAPRIKAHYGEGMVRRLCVDNPARALAVFPQ